MKKLLILFLAFSFSYVAQAQEKKIAPSPASTLIQTVGLTDITVEYSRPGMKGRTIYAADGLAPFGKVWRTGANSATKITFSTDVTVEGQAVPAGSYAITTVPGADSWTINFFKHGETRWSSYNGKKADVSVQVKPITIPSTIETFMITVDDIKDDSANMMFLWENTAVPVKIGV